MRFHQAMIENTSARFRSGIYYGIVKYLDSSGEGKIQFLYKDHRHRIIPYEVLFYKEEIRARNYYLNEGEKVKFDYIVDNNTEKAINIIPVALEDIIRNDIHKQIQIRLRRLKK